MVDTQRTKSALAALLADNITQDISPQDVRDFLESMHLAYGVMYVSTDAATSIAVIDTFVKVAGTTTQVAARNFTHSNNRLTYTGTPDINATCLVSFSMTSAGSNQEVDFKIAKNGVVIDDTLIRRKIGTGSDLGAAHVQGFTSLSTNDFVELWVANHSAISNVTVNFMHFIALGVFL